MRADNETLELVKTVGVCGLKMARPSIDGHLPILGIRELTLTCDLGGARDGEKVELLTSFQGGWHSSALYAASPPLQGI